IGYTLTNDQRQVLNEIYKDMSAHKRLNRLLLADVGSGKTLVALISCFMNYLSGYQSALMAPTSILAQQHYESAKELFKSQDLNIVLLTGSTNTIERHHYLNDLKNGRIDLIIGTHALIQDDLIFKKLGLVILDEQQRFGVNQRQALLNKGLQVDVLMLSATPIPRTLAQVYFNNVDVSYMKDNLTFKLPIKSYYFNSSSIKPYYSELIKHLENKMQVYIVTPLVVDNETSTMQNVTKIYNSIKDHFSEQYQVGIIHGQLSNDEKEKVMNEFNQAQIDILVATSLIEVGISVNNANCIIIYDAHNFGLSQLHQLRGRVGRSSTQGYCVFLSNSSNEESINKLEFITKTNDGFEIAFYDLKMRGPGDVLGLRQSGLPSFNMANLFQDEKIYQIALQEALNFIKQPSFKQWYQLNSNYLNIKEGRNI
ncbi:MAG: ATP-dependent DNA helicase RecG, partial [Bacilli bacterium]